MVEIILLAVLLPAQAPAETIAPYNTGYVYTYYMHGQLLYGKGFGPISYADGEGPRGWASFSLVGVPDTLTVTGVAFEFYQKTVYDVPRTYHVKTELNPETADPQTLYDWISYGSSLAHSEDHPDVGWVRREFHPSGVLAIDSSLGESRVTVSFCPSNPCGLGRAWGTDGGALQPRLILTFFHPGVNEPGTIVSVPVARLAPNPACRRVRVSGGRAVTLFDPAGRTVVRLAPGPNDVSGLAPGVYFAPGTATAKLVIRP